ncbi:myo-inositol 2-dehydrogenase [Cutibacterium acnes JCM 18916]|nr:myo-inositol 2-dehydrogenase [Cutibacterium acnes JCM 18916]
MTVSAQAIETVENDDIAVFNMTFESGAIGTIVVSRVAFGLPNSMEFDVFGTQGRASFDLARSGEIIVDDTSTPEGFSGPRQVLSNPTFPYYKWIIHGFCWCWQHSDRTIYLSSEGFPRPGLGVGRRVSSGAVLRARVPNNVYRRCRRSICGGRWENH